ncbi:hypothetical protein HNY73_011868 [Argiope bruennichi]|uniref:Uncharacterized protein n=1 Tax=Argiope bruennichi TaxID=94029 RepID=A0A8T0EV63_ARGBR|nr:hypothetical protein HNY73_011868 [Argiope bruennichi]
MNWRKGMKIVVKRSVVTGVPEILEAHRLSKVLRVSVFLFCISGFLFYTISFLMVYWEYPTVMDVVVDYPEKIEIPAVTICDYNGHADPFTSKCNASTYGLLKNIALQYKFVTLAQIPAVIPYALPNMTRTEFREMGVQSENLIVSCRLRHPAGSYRIFVTLKVKTETVDTFYTSTPSAIQISVHNSRVTMNPFKKGISLKPCYNYNLFISKTMNELLPYPYTTNCTDYIGLWKARGGYGPLSRT